MNHAGTPADSPQQRITTTVNYSGGETADVKSMPAVADWCSGPPSSAAYVLGYRNTPAGQDTTCPVRVYMVVVPVHPENAVQSVTLPYYGTDLTPGTHNPALHVLAMGVRPAAAANLTTSADASGNNHTLALNGRVGFDNAGQGDGAAVFDGSGGYAATSGNVLNTQQSFSIAAWVKAASLGTAHQVAVVQQGTNVGGFYLQYSGSVWEFTRLDSDINGSGGQSAYANSPATTEWTHLVGTWDSTSGTMTLYVNGVAQNATAVEHNAIPSTGPLVIGRGFWNGIANDPFTGELTDVQAYQRTLSASDVSNLYSGAATASLTTPTGWWQLEDFGRNWIGVWAAQPDGPAPGVTPSLAGMTIRQVVHPSDLGYGSVNTLIDGNYNTDINGNPTAPAVNPVQTRIRLTNRYGSAPVKINAATIAAQTTAAGAATGAKTTLTFGGPTTTTVTIDPGAEVASDPVTLPDTTSGSGNLVVSLALDSSTGTPPVANQLTNPAFPVYLASGDQTADTAGAGAVWSTNRNLTGRYLLSGIDITDTNDPLANTQAGTGPGTIAILGDEASGAGDSSGTTWVDMLGKDQKIFNPPFDQNNGPGPNPGGFVNISNTGASVASADSQFGSAPNSTVLDEPNLKAVLITLGINDLKSGASASTIESNINTLVSSLTPYGITNHYDPDGTRPVHVYLATIPDAPGLSAAQETERNNLNNCITSQGANCAVKILFGAGETTGFIDVAGAVTGTGSNPTQAQINSAILAKIEASSMATAW